MVNTINGDGQLNLTDTVNYINRDGLHNMSVTVNTINGDGHLKLPDTVNYINRDGQMSPPRLVTINHDRVTATGSFAHHG